MAQKQVSRIVVVVVIIVAVAIICVLYWQFGIKAKRAIGGPMTEEEVRQRMMEEMRKAPPPPTGTMPVGPGMAGESGPGGG